MTTELRIASLEKIMKNLRSGYFSNSQHTVEIISLSLQQAGQLINVILKTSSILTLNGKKF